METIGFNKLWISTFSKKQFEEEIEEYPYRIEVDDEMLKKAEEDDFCFIEDIDVSPYFSKVSEIILYRWNREYPADTFFYFPAEEYTQISEEEFKGSSHDAITEECFVRDSFWGDLWDDVP